MGVTTSSTYDTKGEISGTPTSSGTTNLSYDATEPIVRGVQKRRVIDVDRFTRRVQAKRESRRLRYVRLCPNPGRSDNFGRFQPTLHARP